MIPRSGAAAPFGPGVRWVLAIALVSLLASAALAIYGDLLEVPSFGADAFSRSAIGHHAFVETLRALGRNVLVSRSRTAEKGAGAVVVVAEPLVGPAVLDDRSRERLQGIVARADGVLLVLPKRAGYPDPVRPRWLGGAVMVPAYRVDEVLAVAGVRGEVVRPVACSAWTGSLPAPDLDDPQLVISTSLVPLIWTAEGVLAGERTTGGRRLIVVSDPDLLATHGLGRGRNADLALALLERLDPAGGRAVVVDETLHGHELQPSLARELLRWPLALATLQGALALGLLAWAALVRFGRPRQAATGLAPGKAFLVQNTAELLQQGGHVARAVASYWRAAKEQIARTLRPPGELGGDPDTVVTRGAAARGRGEELAVLERRVAELSHQRSGEHDALQVARDVHAFREVMTHAARSDS